MECERYTIDRFDICRDGHRIAGCKVVTDTVDTPEKCEKFCRKIAEKIRVLTENCEILTCFCDIENGNNSINRGKICDISVHIKARMIDENIAYVRIVRVVKLRMCISDEKTCEECFLFDTINERPIPNRAYRLLKCVKNIKKHPKNVSFTGIAEQGSNFEFWIDDKKAVLTAKKVIQEYSEIVRKEKKWGKGLDNRGQK